MEVTLIITPNPLTTAGQRRVSAPIKKRQTLAALLAAHDQTICPEGWVVAIGGFEVAPNMWAHTRLRAGAVVECRAVAKKSFFRFVAPFVLAYYAPGISASLFDGVMISSNVVRAVTAGINIIGTAIINRLLGPKQAKRQKDEQASPTYALSGGRNRARPYEPVALLFGEIRYTPDYASLPYTVFQSSEQYQYCIFHAGINCGYVSEPRLGRTPLSSYSGVTTRTDGISGMPQQALEGWGNVDTISGGELVGAGPWVTRISSPGALVLQIDVEGSLYAVSKSKGSIIQYGINLQAEYRVSGSGGTWLPFFDDGSNNRAVFNASTKPVRLTFTRSVASGQYEVRMRKLEADESTTTRVNSFVWTTLKSVQADTGQYGGMGRYGLKIKASGQINGGIEEFSWLARAEPMPYWNGTAWVTATTRANGLSNPGAIILLYARGIYNNDGKLLAGMGLPDSLINIESLQEFMVWCATNGFRFDAVFDAPLDHKDAIDTIALVGLGSHTWEGGKLGVTWAADNQALGGAVNMATMRAKSFRVDYQTFDTADSVEYTYFDRAREYTWQPIRVKDPDVEVPLNPARISSIGVTEEAHAAIMARFHMGQSLYQRKDITFDTDLEHMTYRRNSLLSLAHDVTQWGYGGRLHSAAQDSSGVVTLELDDVVPAGDSVRYVGLRIPGERSLRVFAVAAFTGSSRILVLDDPWPLAVPFPGDAGNPAPDTLWMYDFKAAPGQRVRVIGIKPQANMAGATISVVPDTDEFWNYVRSGEYEPPAPQSLLPYGLPTITALVITEELQRQGNSYYVELTATFSATGAYRYAQIWAGANGNELVKLGETTDLTFSWRAVLDDEWVIEVRPFGTLNRPGTLAGIEHSVSGLALAPDAPADMAVTPTLLIFSPSEAVDMAGYIARSNPGVNYEWSVATPLHAVSEEYAGGLIPGSPWFMPVRLYGVNTVLLRAVDTSGNLSDVVYDVYDFGFPDAANLAELIDFELLGFPGTITNGSIVSGPDIVADLDPTTDFYGAGAGEDIYFRDGATDIYAGDQYLQLSYVTQFAPSYGGGTMLIDLGVTGARSTVNYRFDGGTTGDVYSGVDIYSGSVGVYGDEQAWKPWPGALTPTLEDVGVQFLIVADAGSLQGVIESFAVRVELPTHEQVFSNVLVDSAGTWLSPGSGVPARKWVEIEDVQITPLNDGSGAISGRVLEIDPVLGAKVELINDVAVSVTGRAFVRVYGYGGT